MSETLDLWAHYFPKILAALPVTAALVSLSVVIGFCLALPIAIVRFKQWPLLSQLATGYVYLFRGTPLLVQLFLAYYGSGVFSGELKSLGLWWIFRDAFTVAVLVFTLNTCAYQSEIQRGAIQSVPKGQWEGGQSLGLGSWVIFFRIILPQAMTGAIRPLGNEVVLMIKGSAIASLVTVFDMMGVTKKAYSDTYNIQVYFMVALLYLVIVELFRRVWDRFEINMTRHLRR